MCAQQSQAKFKESEAVVVAEENWEKVSSSSDSEEEVFVVRDQDSVVDRDSSEMDVVGDHNMDGGNFDEVVESDVVADDNMEVTENIVGEVVDSIHELVSGEDLEDEDQTLPFEEGDEQGMTDWNPNSSDEDEMFQAARSEVSSPDQVLSDDSESSEVDDTDFVRRSTRVSRAPLSFTYDTVGGNPTFR